MSDGDAAELTRLINASGFLLQVGLEHAVRDSAERHPWRVVGNEYPWKDSEAQGEGFIDLVLGTKYAIMAIECKRPRGGTWVFLQSNTGDDLTTDARILWVDSDGAAYSAAGWDDFNFMPESAEAEFCFIRGSGENDSPMLERIAGKLLRAIDALADEEVGIMRSRTGDYVGYYLPVIVTTATLSLCRIERGTIDLRTGEIANATANDVPYVRFRKAFSTGLLPGASLTGIEEGVSSRERTVFVVNAAHFVDFLAGFKADIRFNGLREDIIEEIRDRRRIAKAQKAEE